MFFKIALRNVFRNKRRTFLSLFVVAFGVSILYLIMGFVSESLETTKQSMAQLYGSVQIADENVFDQTTRGYGHLITPETATQIEAILNDEPKVVGYKQELGFFGLIGNEKGSRIVTGSAFVPDNSVEDFSSLIVDGEPLNNSSSVCEEIFNRERPDSEPGDCQVIIGRRLAAALGVQAGDSINVATNSVTGNFSAASAKIMGVFQFNDIDQEGQLGYVSLNMAKKILRTDNIERFVVNIDNLDDAQTFAVDLQQKLNAAGINLSVKPWQDLNPLYDQVQEFGSFFTLFTNIGVFILAFFGVFEVLTMSFLERTREVGTVRAVGTKRWQVFSTFVIEGFVLGVLGGISGVVLGSILGVVVNQLSLTWVPPGSIDPVPVVVQIGLLVAVAPFLIALVSTFLGTLYPAFKSSRFNIVKSLGYV
jgi:putative ABC transport system permease protein